MLPLLALYLIYRGQGMCEISLKPGVLSSVLLLAMLLSSSCATKGLQKPVYGFSEGRLDAAKWHITRKGDFRESTIDVYDVDPADTVDYRLRLRADTIGTEDNTVKFHGVRSAKIIDLSKSAIISFSLDWAARASLIPGGDA